jgi:hypothetical protein
MSEPVTRPNCYRGEAGEVCQSVPSVAVSGNGNSTSTSFSWSKITANKETILIIALIFAVCILGFAISKIQSYEEKYEAAASELKDENRLRRNHDDQLKIELQAAQTVAVLSRCKP